MFILLKDNPMRKVLYRRKTFMKDETNLLFPINNVITCVITLSCDIALLAGDNKTVLFHYN